MCNIDLPVVRYTHVDPARTSGLDQRSWVSSFTVDQLKVVLWYSIGYHFKMTSVEDTYRDRTSSQLRESRQMAGLSLRELARRAGTSHATLIAYEKGIKVPSVVTFFRILESCGFAVDLVTSKRVRHHQRLARGDELAAVLKLAEQFPTRVAKKMDYPVFPNA